MTSFSSTILSLRQERARVWEQARALLDRAERENRDLTTAEAAEFDGLLRRLDELRARIERLERADIEERDLATVDRPGRVQLADDPGFASHPGEVRFLAPNEKLPRPWVPELGMGARPSLARWLRGILTARWDGGEMERRLLKLSDPTLGGYLVPEPLATEVVDLARARSVAIQAGMRTVPMTASTLAIPVLTQDPGAQWRGEGVAVTESDMQFDRVQLRARTLAATTRLSVELLEDAAGIADEAVERALAEALAGELDRVALFGSGTGEEPRGVANWPGIQTVDLGPNGAQLTSYAPFSRAVQMIAEANGVARAVVLSPRDDGTLDRLTDATGQPLRPPASWSGIARLVTAKVPTNLTHGTATNASVALVGDFSQAVIGLRTNVTVEVDRLGSGFQNLTVGVRAYLRADVAVIRPQHFVMIRGIIE